MDILLAAVAGATLLVVLVVGSAELTTLGGETPAFVLPNAFTAPGANLELSTTATPTHPSAESSSSGTTRRFNRRPMQITPGIASTPEVEVEAAGAYLGGSG